MQDSLKESVFEKEFVHDSWLSLKEQLDNEMPERRSPSKKWIALLLCAQFVSLAVIGYLLNERTQQVPFAQTTKETTKVETVHLTEYIEVPVINNDSRNRSQFVPQNISTSLSPEPGINNVIYTFSALPTIKESTPEKRELSLTNVIDLKNISRLYTIPELDMSFALERKTKKGLLSKDIFKNGLSFGIGLISSSSFNGDYTGYGILGSLNFEFNKKWSLSTGIAYNQISREFIFAPFLPKAEASYSVSLKEINLDQSRTFYRSLSDMKQILIPFMVNYSVTPKFGIIGGLKLRYTFNMNVDGKLKSALVQKTAASLVDPQTAYYNQAQIGAAIGFSFTPTDNFSLNLDSEFGLNNLINKNQFDSGSRGYALGLINLSGQFKF